MGTQNARGWRSPSPSDEKVAGILVAGFSEVVLPGYGWVVIEEFRREPDGSLYVSGSRADTGEKVHNVLLPEEELLSARA